MMVKAFPVLLITNEWSKILNFKHTHLPLMVAGSLFALEFARMWHEKHLQPPENRDALICDWVRWSFWGRNNENMPNLKNRQQQPTLVIKYVIYKCGIMKVIKKQHTNDWGGFLPLKRNTKWSSSFLFPLDRAFSCFYERFNWFRITIRIRIGIGIDLLEQSSQTSIILKIRLGILLLD